MPMRYFTKSKFKLGRECPTKLFYAGKAEYANANIEDSFLKSLADGGFQVGALARCYFPDGILVETPNDEAAATATAQYLKDDKITLFEAVFKFDNYLVRCDVIVKDGNQLDLFEVKAKSCSFTDESGMLTQKGTIGSDWRKYIEDVAFQKHVISLARPELFVRAHLMLVDKMSVAPTDGLNQKFRLVREEGKRHVEIADTLTATDLTPQILRAIKVDETCDKFFAELIDDYRFDDYVAMLADCYSGDEKIITEPRSVCKDCEFRLADSEKGGTLRSGYRECWSHSLGWTDSDFDEATVLDVWDLRSKDKFMADRRIKFSDLTENDIKPKPDGKPGISRTERQWKQIDLVQRSVKEPFFDRENLAHEIASWQFPLHFIDFETSMPAIPFKQGRRPYEGVLFQFSHHTFDENGLVKHAGEFISAEPGTFPNYDCVRELMLQIGGEPGTVFRYAAHENSYLCAIREQLLRDPADIADRAELVAFIESIANPRKDKDEPWTTSRPMVDLLELVKRYHYDPATNGSNSLKFVLPATLNSSTHLQEKYSQPIYGGAGEIHSKNFRDQIWIQYDASGRVIDPYKLLPMMFTDESESDYAAVMEMDKIKDGGAAMTAYSKLQFEDIPRDARNQMESALLKYCELDTLAMVMIYEAWMAEIA